MTKINVHEGGFVIKSLFRETTVYEREIKNAVFNRVNMKKIKITVSTHDDGDIKINSAKYSNITPLIVFLAKFKESNN